MAVDALDEREDYTRRVGPLLLGGLVACLAAAASLANTLEEPAFELLLFVMTFVGVGASFIFGRRGGSSSIAGIIIIAVAVASLAQRLSGLPAIELLYPPEVVADEDLTWAALCAWLMVGFCFMLSRRRNILFVLVAGLAVFGLNATVNLNPAVLVNFAVFIFAAVFIWGYEHLLNVGEQAGTEAAADWLAIARTQALAGTMLVALLLALGIAVGSGLHLIGPRLYIAPGGMAHYARWMQRNLLSYGGVLNSFRVGQGPVNLPATPAIMVEANTPALWRGSAYDYYTGNGWTRELPGALRLHPDADGWLSVPGWETWPGKRNHQRVTILNMDARAVYAAARPARARLTEASWESTRINYRFSMDAYGAMQTQSTMVPGTQYEVISIMPPTDPEILRATPTNYSQFVRETYIEQMQVQAEAELSGLVAEVTADAETPYDKVIALRDFLGSNCVYTTRAPAVPRGNDVAAYFVTSSRRGACDLFATSLAVMCRLAGVPARVATGFQVGQYDSEDEAYVALQRDAHAWAEVYFPTIGWVPFDVSAERSEAGDSLWAMLRDPRWRRQAGEIAEGVWSVVVVVAAALALLSAVLGPGALIRWLAARARRRGPRERMGEVFEWFRRRAARLTGTRPERWKTPAEVESELVASGRVGDETRALLSEFTSAFYDHRYGREEPDMRRVRRVRSEARSLIRRISRDLHATEDRKDETSREPV